jgi:hypothetical protein
MTGRCSKCKEMCEATEYYEWSEHKQEGYHIYLSNCCLTPLIEDGERSHDD